MFGIEHSGHGIEQVFVLVEILLFLDVVKFEALSDMLVFKDLTCPYILYELFQHTSRIFSEETGLFLSFKNLLV